MPQLVKRLFELYGTHWDFYEILSQLEKIMRKAAKENELLTYPQQENKSWIENSNTVGITLYVDLFSNDLQSLISHISYFEELGINYVHLMPLFARPKGENDGGYAVSSYRKIQKPLGTITDLAQVATAFHAAGIKLVVDFVFNHTSDQHKWAIEAKKGNKKYTEYYFIYSDKSEVDRWNNTLREIFPNTRQGSFTYVKEVSGWVWTTFNSFQWDLNYSNPHVFIAMCKEMLFLANLGIDVLRLDALAFVWKQKETICENLPQAHILIQSFQYVAKIACPSLIFKSEAIVHPDQVIQYIKADECALSYNPLQMALFWSSLASRDTRLLTHSLQHRWHIPEKTNWVNYIRCHDDIGWTFSDEDAAEIGINGYDHRNFLNKFYTGRFKGSFAKGEPFQLNIKTGDCRVCGTMASLAGLEQAELKKNSLYRKMAIARIKMIYAVLFALPGIPLIYQGDEWAHFNDYNYLKNKKTKTDSRWVHRIKHNWEKPYSYQSQKEIYEIIKKLIWSRKTEQLLSGSYIQFYNTQDSHVFAFSRGKIDILANFSESDAFFTLPNSKSQKYIDILSKNTYKTNTTQKLTAYEVRWLKEYNNEIYNN